MKILLNYRKIINFFLVRISLFFKTKRCLGLPFNILIEPTGSCNYQCVKCERFSKGYVDDGPVYGHKNMPFEYYRQIIDDIGDTLLTLRLWHYGEPLMNTDIFRMIKYAKRKNIIVAVSSNLSLLTKEDTESFIKSGLDYLIVSFDGASRETYNLYHGGDYFSRVVNNIRTLVKAKKRLRSSLPFIELQFIVMKENESEIGKVRELVCELGVDKLAYLKLSEARINFDKFRHICIDKKSILPQNRDFYFEDGKKELVDFCSIPWEETLIRYSGVVIPCSVDIKQKYETGRVFRNGKYVPFKKVWNNSNYCSFRQKVAVDLDRIDICSICEKRDNNANDQIKLNRKYSLVNRF